MIDENVYDKIIETLERKGWCKGTGQDHQGRVCLGWSLNTVLRDLCDSKQGDFLDSLSDVERTSLRLDMSFRVTGFLLDAGEQHLGRRFGLIPPMNDDRKTSYEDILEIVRIAHKLDDASKGVT